MNIKWTVREVDVANPPFRRDGERTKLAAYVIGQYEGFENPATTRLEDVHSALQNLIDGRQKLAIKNVIFNNPATIIIWTDGTKSVVKCQDGDTYNEETGFVLAYLKKLLGNDNTFNKEITKWVPKKDTAEFEKLGYEPDKLREIVRHHNFDKISKAIEAVKKSCYVYHDGNDIARTVINQAMKSDNKSISIFVAKEGTNISIYPYTEEEGNDRN